MIFNLLILYLERKTYKKEKRKRKKEKRKKKERESPIKSKMQQY